MMTEMPPKILKAYPPNFVELNKRFNIKGKPVVFAWGNVIYDPTGMKIPEPLYQHELVHCGRQLNEGVESWWRKYINDREFLCNEEIYAHRAELKVLLGNPNQRGMKRETIDELYRITARRLSDPLYGPVISFQKAYEKLRTTD